MSVPETSLDLWHSGGAIFAVATLLLAGGLRYSGSVLARRVSVPLMALAVGLGAAWFAERWWIGLCAGMVWLAMPLVQMIHALLKVRVARRRELRPALTYAPEFAALRDISREFEALDFRIVEDCELKPGDPRQVFRFLVSPDARHLVALGWVSQGPWVLTYSAISSWEAGGHHWLTWNYPLPYGLKTSPDVSLWRCTTADTAEALLGAHLEFLRLNEIPPAERQDLGESDTARDVWLNFIQHQLEYNLREGWLHVVDDGRHVAYSLRGLVGACRQLFRLLLESR
jgi:hypothetical protein